MYNQYKIDQIREYSDDDIVFEPPADSELDDIEAYDKSINTYTNGSPNDGHFTNLGNPNRHNKEESLNYSVDYYYCTQNNTETFHIFRTIKGDKKGKNGKIYFPPIDYMENIQKLQGISLMKLVEFSERDKWIHFEYVPGGTLYDSLKFGRQFNGGDKFKILYGIAITMNSLHEKGLFHLDIRLESIVVTISENKPVLADVDMMVHLYETRDDYDDQFLPYLDPKFNSNNTNESMRADIFSYGVMMNLFILKNTKTVEKDNIQKIKEAYAAYKNSAIKDEEQKLTLYLSSIGIELNKETSDDMEKGLLKISKECMFGSIRTAKDLIEKLNESIGSESYIKGANNLLNQELFITEDDNHVRDFNNEKFNFERSTLSIVEQSASNLNAKDIWLINKRDELKKRSIQQRAAEASLYATITGDFTLYENVLKEEVIPHKK